MHKVVSRISQDLEFKYTAESSYFSPTCRRGSALVLSVAFADKKLWSIRVRFLNRDVKNDRGSHVRRILFRGTSDTDRPTTAVLRLEEIGVEVELELFVVHGLRAANACVVKGPAVALRMHEKGLSGRSGRNLLLSICFRLPPLAHIKPMRRVSET